MKRTGYTFCQFPAEPGTRCPVCDLNEPHPIRLILTVVAENDVEVINYGVVRRTTHRYEVAYPDLQVLGYVEDDWSVDPGYVRSRVERTWHPVTREGVHWGIGWDATRHEAIATVLRRSGRAADWAPGELQEAYGK